MEPLVHTAAINLEKQIMDNPITTSSDKSIFIDSCSYSSNKPKVVINFYSSMRSGFGNNERKM